jgi:DNA polymerase-4
MDAFYASVEQRDRPELRGKPVIVGGSAQDRGVVSAASYEARAFGVHSAMPMRTAQRLCPQAVVLPVRMDHYARIARQLRGLFLTFTPFVEPLSLDEAFLDVRGSIPLFGPAVEIACQIKGRIRAELELTASVGVAGNKFLAKLASDLSKPDGLAVIPVDRVRTVLDPLPVGRLPGVGVRGETRLRALGLQTVGQLAVVPERILIEHFGEAGRHLGQLARGIDERPVVPDETARSLSTETTFPRDLDDRAVLRACLRDLVEELGQRLRHQGLRARTVELKARTAEFRTHSRSLTLPDPTDLTAELWQAVGQLFELRLPDEWLPLRLLGVGAAGLVRDPAVQGDLFDDGWRQKQRSLDRTVDAIRQKFGDQAIRRGGNRPNPGSPG